MSIYSYDHGIFARSREVIRQSLELLREVVRRHRNNHIGESVEPENGTRSPDAANDRRSFDESGSRHRGWPNLFAISANVSGLLLEYGPAPLRSSCGKSKPSSMKTGAL